MLKGKKINEGLVSLCHQNHKKHMTPATEEAKYTQMNYQHIRCLVCSGAPSHQHRDTLSPQPGQWFDRKIQSAQNPVLSGLSRSPTLLSHPAPFNLFHSSQRPSLELVISDIPYSSLPLNLSKTLSLHPIHNNPTPLLFSEQTSLCELTVSPTLSIVTKF